MKGSKILADNLTAEQMAKLAMETASSVREDIKQFSTERLVEAVRRCVSEHLPNGTPFPFLFRVVTDEVHRRLDLKDPLKLTDDEIKILDDLDAKRIEPTQETTQVYKKRHQIQMAERQWAKEHIGATVFTRNGQVLGVAIAMDTTPSVGRAVQEVHRLAATRNGPWDAEWVKYVTELAGLSFVEFKTCDDPAGWLGTAATPKDGAKAVPGDELAERTLDINSFVEDRDEVRHRLAVYDRYADVIAALESGKAKLILVPKSEHVRGTPVVLEPSEIEVRLERYRGKMGLPRLGAYRETGRSSAAHPNYSNTPKLPAYADEIPLGEPELCKITSVLPEPTLPPYSANDIQVTQAAGQRVRGEPAGLIVIDDLAGTVTEVSKQPYLALWFNDQVKGVFKFDYDTISDTIANSCDLKEKNTIALLVEKGHYQVGDDWYRLEPLEPNDPLTPEGQADLKTKLDLKGTAEVYGRIVDFVGGIEQYSVVLKDDERHYEDIVVHNIQDAVVQCKLLSLRKKWDHLLSSVAKLD